MASAEAVRVTTELTVAVLDARLTALQEKVSTGYDALRADMATRHDAILLHLKTQEEQADKSAQQHNEAHVALHLAAEDARKAMHDATESARKILQEEIGKQETRSEAAMQRRSEQENGTRQQMISQAGTYATSEKVDILAREFRVGLATMEERIGKLATTEAIKTNTDRISSLERWQANIQGRMLALAAVIPLVTLGISWLLNQGIR